MARLAHVYGGATLMSLALSFIYWPLGCALGGAFLVYLGLTWVKD